MARVQGLWRHMAFIPCIFAYLQHETSQAREASDESAGASGAGRGFEACGVTGRPSPACSRTCNTRHRRHASASDKRAAASGARARVRGLWRHEASILCMQASQQHETSQAREASDERAGASGAGRGFKACGVTWRSSPACSHTCNTRHRRHAGRHIKEPTPLGQGTGSKAVDSHGVHVLHARIPATRNIAGGVR